MNATLEMLHDAPGRPQAVGILRVGPEHGTFLDPFCWACTVIWRNQSMVELLGCDRKVTPPIGRAIWERLQDEGVKIIQEVRGSRVVFHDLTKPPPNTGDQ